MAKEIKSRLSRLRKALAAKELDAVLITCPENRFYLSGFLADDVGLDESAGCLLITRQENLLLTDGRYKEQAESQAPFFQTIIYKKGVARLLRQLFGELQIKRCGYEPAFVSCAMFKRLKKALSPSILTEFGDLIFRMRSVKGAEELETIKKAQQIAEEVFEGVVSTLRPGLSEREIAFEILRGLYLKADGPSFPPIVASGPNSALPHAVPSERKIKEGEPIVIDMGARFEGYCSDMTRTMFLGEPKGFFKKIYMVVKDAQEAAQEAIKAGITGREADNVAREVIKKHGFDGFFCHGLGHGVGVAIHEAPALSYRNRKRLRSGMVVTIEPGIYVAGKGGVRLENMAVVKEDGIEIITSNKWYYDFGR